jgi:hypothetical protein
MVVKCALKRVLTNNDNDATHTIQFCSDSEQAKQERLEK